MGATVVGAAAGGARVLLAPGAWVALRGARVEMACAALEVL